ncbi:PTS system D-fructose-specific IIB component (F1P-forming), Frc family (TC 4.A.2.1.1)/PTS system D-fructose-specific IIC component (F1P-forming), Frc family (TC 4.A.2.1.1) [Pasteurella testudinis DSM 23072]|uniref:protein-N(pi)-phosphohistidine--D-fructose phosphotransferase n=1 Tax=Pasteurella testudinis DSM 23072 TaxID=1122938 RepID=A0A1W1V3N3_9PAST|nr:PTS fructose transporter subunit IIBC [Pasteurella testudinis]SMB87664.1 PTS system D-fructose-specific IIB component (F1P-forming), Frc family (TC 4.A.2.1.1)/PTS system D-fructose-specific IIC component (F1P-forming), Frc family (TC 4.A.2.1.1) [Pasteurella testudinis DSM 23072]SUB50470.1 PTS system fructose-specific transporter subunit IIBC [Pasteurella testudinis]
MKILLLEDVASGKAKGFLVRQVLAAAAANAGHTVVENAADAEIALVLGANLPNNPQLTGKKVYLTELASAFAAPEQTLSTAVENAADYVTPSESAVSAPSTGGVKNIVAVTACPTGVAHTFMSAEAIEAYAKQQGWNVKVETRGQVGAGNPISAEEVAAADLVFVAADIDVDLSKFDGKLMYRTSTGLALKKTAAEFDKAFKEAKIFTATAQSAVKQEVKTEKKGVYSHLMTGVSHMLPVVVAGGLIIALSFVFGIEAFKEEGTLAAALMQIGGGSAFGLMIPVLSGYIAYSIADRPGLTPGLVGGMLASSIGAGFLGGIISGFLAGYVAKAIADHVKLPPTMNALKPILIIPFIATLVVGLIMIYIVGEPVAWIMRSMTEFLTGMQSGSAIMLGIILGAMMCFDMGGPVNKAAYTFGVGLLASSSYLPMAAVMAAGMVPALGMGLATFLARKKFSASEREGGKASFVLGLCFISEGAIPFAARDPMRVIPSCMAGGALTGALSMLFGAQLMAPHGGIFVLAIPGAIQPVLLYLVAILAGTAVTGFLYAAIKPKEESLV